jgi:peptide/nickel transport system ATP-binding protein
LVFQDPYSALNPKLTVGSALEEVLVHAGVKPTEATHHAGRLLEEVGLEASDAAKYPGGFSGGQRQRIVIARALAVEPEFVVLDESVAALDVQIQRDVLELLDRIGRERQLTYLFISHDLDVVASFCNRLIILEKGRIVEAGETEDILRQPATEYTTELLASRPKNLR